MFSQRYTHLITCCFFLIAMAAHAGNDDFVAHALVAPEGDNTVYVVEKVNKNYIVARRLHDTTFFHLFYNILSPEYGERISLDHMPMLEHFATGESVLLKRDGLRPLWMHFDLHSHCAEFKTLSTPEEDPPTFYWLALWELELRDLARDRSLFELIESNVSDETIQAFVRTHPNYLRSNSYGDILEHLRKWERWTLLHWVLATFPNIDVYDPQAFLLAVGERDQNAADRLMELRVRRGLFEEDPDVIRIPYEIFSPSYFNW